MATAVDYLAFQAALQPDRLAAVDLETGRQWTYGEFDGAVARCAAVLARRNVGPAGRVAALARNCVELVLVQLACARLGALYVPLNWRLSAAELGSLLEDADPLLLVGDENLPTAGFDGVSIGALAAEIATVEPLSAPPMDPDRPSLLLYTSGTSGTPKGALLSERNLTETAINFSILGRVTHESVFLCDSPMFHIIGLVASVRPALMRGGAILVSRGFDATCTLSRLSDARLGVTHYFCVPQMAASLRAEGSFDAARLRGLTALFTGGAPHAAASILAWLEDGIPVADGYGMSETGTVFGMPVDAVQIAARAGSAGVATPRVHTRIVNGEGCDCPPGEPGELLVKGANVMREYWRRPHDTQAAFTADGWFRTGDIARCDEAGYHWLVDRCKDVIISGGENVYPGEIEAVLAEQNAIVECAVVGVPDERWGEVGHLFLVAAPGVVLDAETIMHGLRQRLARYKIPKHVSIVEGLPRNGAGKVLKRTLRQMASLDATDARQRT